MIPLNYLDRLLILNILRITLDLLATVGFALELRSEFRLFGALVLHHFLFLVLVPIAFVRLVPITGTIIFGRHVGQLLRRGNELFLLCDTVIDVLTGLVAHTIPGRGVVHHRFLLL